MSEDASTIAGGFGAGARIAGYLLEEQIGQGGMAVVFRAVDERLDRRVALKILAPALAADEAFRHRFIRESRAAAAVDNPHIIPVFEAGEASGVLYIAMRYVPGGDVRSLLRSSGPLPAWRTAGIVSQAASALDAAHERGLVHRDVKPANMLLEPAGPRPDYIYLSDFGLSKGMLPSVELTRTGQFLGTPDYMSPEQIEGAPVDGRTDQYSLGCVAYELLCGSPPFASHDLMAAIYAHQHQMPPPPSSRVPGLPAALDQVFVKVLAKSPADRYESCRAFAEALQAALDEDAAGHPAPGTDAPGRSATEVAMPRPVASDAGARPAATEVAGLPPHTTPPPGTRPEATQVAGLPPHTTPPPGTGTEGTRLADRPEGTAGPQAVQPPGAGADATRLASVPTEATEPASPSRPGVPPSRPTEIRSVSQIEPAGPAAPAGPPGSGGPAEPAGSWTGSGAPGAGPAAGQATRPWWRSPVAVAAAVIVIVALGGGYLLFGRGGGNNSHGHGHGHGGGGGGTILAIPGCSSASVLGKAITSTQSNLVFIGQSPTGVAATPNGQWVFASTVGNTAQAGSVIAMRVDTGLTLTIRRSPYQFTSPARSVALTSDGRYLLVAAGAGISVLNVHTFTRGARGAQVGTLPLPRSTGQGGVLDVALSSGNKYVFMAPVHGDDIAVFNFAKALASGHLSISDLVGNIQLGSQPTAMAMSPDGNWLYVTSSPGGRANTAGRLTVLNVRTAEVNPLASVTRTVGAGCYPSGVTTSTDGSVVWVSARDSDDVLSFSAAKLQADPKHALIAVTRVGREPMGLIVAADGSRLVVADSDAQSSSAKGYLSVLSTAATPAGKATLLGSIPTGQAPQDLTLVPGTQVMLITDSGSNQIQLINLATLP